MMKMTSRALCRAGVMAAAVALTACAPQAPRPLYQWGAYQGKLYEYFKNDGANAGEQITVLEQQLGKSKAAGQTPPPGLHGHLALLYTKLGNDTAAREHLQAERSLFPESAAYVDFLLKAPNPAAAAKPTT